MVIFRRINPDAFKKYWCELKHLLIDRELGVEYVSNVARQVTTEEDAGEIIAKSNIISEFISHSEVLIQDLLALILVEDNEADASWVRVDEEQFRRFLQQIGHIVCCEEHYVDHIKAGCAKIAKTKNDDERERLQDEVNQLLVRMDQTRNVRQSYINSFIAPLEEVERE